MSERQFDDALRARFEGLRADVARAGRVPEFRAVLERAEEDAAARPALGVLDGGREGAVGSRRRFVRVGAWASAALAATAAGVLLTDGGPSEDEEFARLVAAYSADVSAGGWSSPTSGLLEVPGIELVRSLPTIGSSVRGIDPSAEPAAATSPGARDGV